MELIDVNRNGATLTIGLQGHIDSANAAAVEEEITRARTEEETTTAVVDCEKLTYISSAGLRMILRLKKAIADTSVINASPEVYEIFDMTGFTEMMTVQKAYRVISVDGCEVIGKGANGEVYRIDADTIVKVYLKPDSLADIHRERELARTAFVLGVPTAIPYDVVRIQGGGYGSVFELLNAKSYGQLLQSGEKTVDEIVAMGVDVLKTVHATVLKGNTLPEMRKIALERARFLKDHLPAEQADKLLALVEALPENHHMLHGDFHVKNVMVQSGESLLIDMDTLCVGDPVFEFAGMFNAYQGYSELDPDNMMAFFGIPYETGKALWEKTVASYFAGKSQEEIDQAIDKARLIGYARLLRRELRHDHDEAKIAHYRRQFQELLPRVDSLAIGLA